MIEPTLFVTIAQNEKDEHDENEINDLRTTRLHYYMPDYNMTQDQISLGTTKE